MKKELVLEFIADLIFPIDPMVFAGYGTEYQHDNNKCFNEDHPEQIMEVEDRYISDFLDGSDLNGLLDIMIDILFYKPNNFSNNLPLRRADNWDYYVILVISNIGKRIPKITIEKLNTLLSNDIKQRKNVIEILAYMGESFSQDELQKIKSNYTDLSEEELEYINDFEIG